MPTITKELVIAAPADAVWKVLGPGFASIGDWATAVPASSAVPTVTAADSDPQHEHGQPVAGRVCSTGVRLVPEVTETLIAYDEANRSLTYAASGMPAFVTRARNTWTVVPLSEQQSKVTIDAQFDTRGIIGALARRLLLLQVGRTSRHLADDLRHYVEYGTPSPRKRQQRTRHGGP